jgi:hypothetical protein
MQPDLTHVVCLCTGDKYPFIYVDRLYRGLTKNTTHPFVFQPVTVSRYPGWWGKMEQFAPTQRTLLLDIDIVITGNVDFLFEYGGQFCAWKDPWQPGMNGSVYALAPGFGAAIKEKFVANADTIMRQYYSEQEFLRDQTSPEYWPAGRIKSYKADHLEGGPSDARIVVFHGRPKPHECGNWVRDYWK